MEVSRFNLRFMFSPLPPRLKHLKVASSCASALTWCACFWTCQSCRIPASLTRPARGLDPLTFQNAAAALNPGLQSSFSLFLLLLTCKSPLTSLCSVQLTQNSNPWTHISPLCHLTCSTFLPFIHTPFSPLLPVTFISLRFSVANVAGRNCTFLKLSSHHHHQFCSSSGLRAT